MPSLRHRPLVLSALLAFPLAAGAQNISRVKTGDENLDCAGIAAEQKTLAEVIAAGDPNAPSMGKAAAGTAANVGGQVAGAVVAQGSGLFGAFGGLVSKVAGAVAQQQVEEKMAPDPLAQQRASEAKERSAFLGKLASARTCRGDDPGFAGTTLSADAFRQLAEGPAAGAIKPLTAAEVSAALRDPATPLKVADPLEGKLKIAGKKIYISEFRVLFEVSGEVSAHTRAGYMPGTNYGATNSKIKYKVANVDIAALQALTDKAWADFTARLGARGLRFEDGGTFTAAHGAVYAATEPASAPGAPVYAEQDLGYTTRKYLVLAPTGMKLHSRGFAGLGAGDIGKRMEFVKNGYDGIAVGIAVNIAALETSGSGSSILNRSGASTAAGEGMSVSAPPNGQVAAGHADAGAVLLAKSIAVPGSFARFREVGGYDTQKDGVVRALQAAGNLAGVAANKSKTVEMEIDLDGPATSKMALTGIATVNELLANRL